MSEVWENEQEMQIANLENENLLTSFPIKLY